MAVVEVDNVTKIFPARRGARDLRGRGGLGDWIRGTKTGTVTALQNISLTVEAGESLGIIGRNGSGKSTLLSIIAGVTLPTSGQVTVHGRVASLLELGAGFHPMLTGRENVYLNAGLLGMRHEQVDEVFDRIVEFSGIGEFIDHPIDTYSSGMYVRIGFSIAVHTNPDVFLADEVLSVGDEEFQRKCRQKIGELREQKKTIIFVSHDLGIVNSLCERVVLLDRGRMLHRDTVQKTISFYLRQVGRDRGVHTFTEGAIDAVQCDGRISLFYKQEEVTASHGINMFLESLGQTHLSTSAEWEVTERTPNACTARGVMTRLPIALIWSLSLQNQTLRWSIALEALREINLDIITIMFHWPIAYDHWHYGRLSGKFQEINPSDTTINIAAVAADVMPNRSTVMPMTAVFPEEQSLLPPLITSFEQTRYPFAFFWANSDYMTYCRLLFADAHLIGQDRLFTPGRHELITLEVSLWNDRDSAKEQVTRLRNELRSILNADRALTHGPFSAYLEEGRLRLAYQEQEFTSFLHFYASMLVQQLWNDSHNLHWISARSDGQRIEAVGESRRFPFQQLWEVEKAEAGFAIRIWLDVREAFDVQEYHASIVLLPAYASWKTDHEEGEFTPFDPQKDTWIHLNKTYAPGKRAEAWGPNLPVIALEATTDDILFRMTPINTKLEEKARVLQALRTSSAGPIHFEPGRHLYFSGKINIAPPRT
ncbi:MAG TPA: ABC transporter ATP-binding protein [Candidatus Hydrogenedentes bacterium]|nr:ABC transporter ATP-binding protein [Candidatus Hydrogenedentota bacterium]